MGPRADLVALGETKSLTPTGEARCKKRDESFKITPRNVGVMWPPSPIP